MQKLAQETNVSVQSTYRAVSEELKLLFVLFIWGFRVRQHLRSLESIMNEYG